MSPKKMKFGVLPRLLVATASLVTVAGVDGSTVPAARVEVLERGENRLRIRIVTETPERISLRHDGAEVDILRIEGAGHRMVSGEPPVPSVGRIVALPSPDATLDVRVTGVDRVRLPPIRAVLAGATRTQDPSLAASGGIHGMDASFAQLSAVENEKRFLPARPYSIERFSYRGHALARVMFYPVRVQPSTGAVEWLRSAEFEIVIGGESTHGPGRGWGSDRLGELGPRLLNPDAARRWRRSPQAAIPVVAAPNVPGMLGITESSVRIIVDEEGMVSVTGADLESAGVRLRDVDISTLALSEAGTPEPIRVESGDNGRLDATDRILFHGRPPKGRYTELDLHTDENVYFLSWGGTPGAQMVDEDGAPTELDGFIQPTQFEWSVHIERDSLFARLGQNGTEDLDHWFWRSVRAPLLSRVLFDLPSPDPDGFDADIRVYLQGSTYPDDYPDHHVELFLNGHQVADVEFDGQLPIVVDGSVPMAKLNEENNDFSLVAPGDNAEVDEVFLNWIEITYDRLYEARDGVLAFTAPSPDAEGLYQFALTGFDDENIRLFKLGVGEILNGRIRPVPGGGYGVTFQDQLVTGDLRYLAISEDRFVHPVRVEAVPEGADLRSANRSAEFLLLGPEEFSDALGPYVDWKRGLGFDVEFVSVEDIFHQFGAGRPSPEAIRSFLRTVVATWSTPKLTSVLLVGDGTWDPRNRLGGDPDENRVPAGLDFNVNWGQTASDNWYALLSDDGLLPELAIGRWTVRNEVELQAVIAKMMEAPEPGDWRRRIEIIGGDGDPFRALSESFIEHQLPARFVPQRVYTTEDTSRVSDPHFRGGQELRSDLDDGVLLANFQGHGGGGIWSDADLLAFDDVPLLRNSGRYPTIFSLTCYTAAYADPGPAAIGESFIVEADRGGAVFIGSSGLSYQVNGANLDRSLLTEFFAEPGRTIGEVFVDAKIDFYAENDGLIPRDMVRAYNLLGDPTFVPPVSGVELVMETTPESTTPSGQVDIQGQATSGTVVRITLHDADDKVVDQHEVTADGAGMFQTAVDVPDTAHAGAWTVRAHDLSTDDFSGDPIGVGSPVIGTLIPDPSPAREGDSLFVRMTSGLGGVHDRFELIWAINSNFSSPDTLAFVETGEAGEWATESPIPAQPGGRILHLYVLANGDGVETWTGAVETITVLRREDLTFADHQGPIATFAGVEAVTFGVPVANSGQVPVTGAEVRFGWLPFEGEEEPPELPDSLWNAFPGETRPAIDVPAKGEARAEVIWDLPSGQYWVQVEIDPDDGILESSEGNNRRTFEVAADRFSVSPDSGSGGAMLSADGNLLIDVPGESVTDVGVLVVERISMPIPQAQPDYAVPLVADSSQGVAYRISLADTLAQLGTFSVSLELAGQADEDAAFYRWDGDRSKWVRAAGSVPGGSTVSVDDLSGAGTFTVLENEDHTPPLIEIQSGGRVIPEGGYVPKKPAIDFLVQDANGIDVNEGAFEVEIDGEMQPASAYSVSPNPRHPNLVSLRIQTDLDSGTHEVAFGAQDVNGNGNESRSSFVIGSRLRIVAVGNYPNPADDRGTIFAFTLESEVDEVRLSIFTPSGRLVKEFDDRRDPGIERWDYSEVNWDLEDRDGYPVANGVYFYRIEAKVGEEKITHVGKMAVLR